MTKRFLFSGAVRPAGAPATPSRLDRLRAAPRKPGEASFFFFDAHSQSDAVKVLPGEYFVHHEDLLLTTTLGSCISVCLWDRSARVGGMNHFMLPEGSGAQDCGRYGGFAMELLINELLKKGALRGALEAKVFGGGQVISGMHSLNVGERNTEFVMDYLGRERIPVVSKDVLGGQPRKVAFFPASGKALVKRLGGGRTEAMLELDRAARLRAALPAGAAGTIDLF
ncbi:chemoreceptor glutamine deamidase CheD [Ramlibacter sp. 2FC]|uniref:chemoreceptor glutamine deamidase CheD n=1 Tax=Ramlibacter sp. 2FC TaxID=2502188 RepID=UPI0010F8D14E|nr:chemoreceptor glutamine deamidase CheD [Ramlibacter sp. 2FC]